MEVSREPTDKGFVRQVCLGGVGVAAAVWVQIPDPGPVHSQCHRSGPMPHGTSKSRYHPVGTCSSKSHFSLTKIHRLTPVVARAGSEENISVLTVWFSPDLALLHLPNQIKRGSFLTLTITSPFLPLPIGLMRGLSLSFPGWWVLLGSSLRSARCTFGPGQVSLGDSSPRSSTAHTRKATPPLSLWPPAPISSILSFPRVCSALSCHHIFFSFSLHQ